MAANIAEGYGRGGPGEFEQFLRYSRGSVAETDNWLYQAFKRGLITKERYDEYQKKLDELSKMTASFISRLRQQTRNSRVR